MRGSLIPLSVNMNEQTAEDLKAIMKAGEITATEAIRRAVAVYKILDEERRQHRRILTTNRSGRRRREVKFL